jgi:hypothetical protein
MPLSNAKSRGLPRNRTTLFAMRLKTKNNLKYIKIQSAPRSKHTPSLLYKPVS